MLPSYRLREKSRDELEHRVEELETALREIDRVEKDRTIPDRHATMIDSCNETCLNECGALARKALRKK